MAKFSFIPNPYPSRSSNIKEKKRLLTITHLDTRMGFDAAQLPHADLKSSVSLNY